MNQLHQISVILVQIASLHLMQNGAKHVISFQDNLFIIFELSIRPADNR